MGRRRVIVLGLDCAEPRLVFEQYAHLLPTLTALRECGVGGRLQSTIPPITVPAWACMMTGCSPGTLGLYGFRDRASYRYGDVRLASSCDVTQPTVWQLVSDAGEPVVVVGVPPSYPPYAVRGALVSCFLTPSAEVAFAHPPELARQILDAHPDYRVDVEDFRRGDLERLRAELRRSVDQRFDVFASLLQEHDWTFAIIVEMALDRAHHAFWHHAFAEHPRFVADSAFASTITDLYAHLDGRIGELLSALDRSDTTVFVLSDHGAQSMAGGFCINEWLMRRGDLACFHAPEGPASLEQCGVDWSRTTAWAAGGYCARLYLNVQGREPCGRVPADEMDAFRRRLRAALEALTDEAGTPMGNVVYEPEQIYPIVRGIAPDLIVYLGNLRWRAIGSLGHESLFVRESDTGPDGANHTAEGLWIASGSGVRPQSESVSAAAVDVAPTILRALGLPIPAHVEGTPIDL